MKRRQKRFVVFLMLPLLRSLCDFLIYDPTAYAVGYMLSSLRDFMASSNIPTPHSGHSPVVLAVKS